MLSGQGFSSLMPIMWHRATRRKRDRPQKEAAKKGGDIAAPFPRPCASPTGERRPASKLPGLVARFLHIGHRLVEVGGDIGAHVLRHRMRPFAFRSEERRLGKGGVSTCRSRGLRAH